MDQLKTRSGGSSPSGPPYLGLPHASGKDRECAGVLSQYPPSTGADAARPRLAILKLPPHPTYSALTAASSGMPQHSCTHPGYHLCHFA